MAYILNLETASTNCSVSLFRDGKQIGLCEDPSPRYTHGELLHLFIEKVLREAEISPAELAAVAVSKGPGSYTGLRIGVSAAKGMCFALGIPLIALPTLRIMAEASLGLEGLLIPVLDARRMEVYSAVYDAAGEQIRETRAEIVTEASFTEFRKDAPLHLLGSGAEKLREVLGTDAFSYHPDLQPSAREMGKLSFERFQKKQFEDTAYFEPFYLKDFIPTQPKSKS